AEQGGEGRCVTVVHGPQDPYVQHDRAFPLGRNNGAENAVCVSGDVAHSLRAEGFDASEDGTGRGTPLVTAFAENSRGELRTSEVPGALSGGGGKPGQGYPAVHDVALGVRRLMP